MIHSCKTGEAEECVCVWGGGISEIQGEQALFASHLVQAEAAVYLWVHKGQSGLNKVQVNKDLP